MASFIKCIFLCSEFINLIFTFISKGNTNTDIFIIRNFGIFSQNIRILS